MPVAKVETNANPPERKVMSAEYSEVYQALYIASNNTWVAIHITHTKPTRLREIANVRRACQRFFAQKDIKDAGLRMVSSVDQKDEFNSIMYVKKFQAV